MKLKAKYKWNGEEVIIKPVFFDWCVGLEYKVVRGHGDCSIFCNSEKDFIFPMQTKFILLFVKVWYLIKKGIWDEIRYRLPYRISRMFKSKSQLPF